MAVFTKPLSGARLKKLDQYASGLKVCIPFNERGGTRVSDIGGTLKAGTISGAAWAGSPTGGGLRFDGTDDYVNIGTALQSFVDYDKPFSFCFWFRFHTYLSNAYHALIGHTAARGTAFPDIEIRITPGDQWEFVFTSAPSTNVLDGFAWLTPVQTIETNRQYFLVYTYDGGNSTASASAYIGGIKQSLSVVNNGANTQSMYQSSYLLDKDVWIGRRNYSTGDMPFPGTIDQLRVYNRVLLPSEVSALNINPFLGFEKSNKILCAAMDSPSSPLDPMGNTGIFGI